MEIVIEGKDKDDVELTFCRYDLFSWFICSMAR